MAGCANREPVRAMISFEVDVEKVSRSRLILGSLAAFFTSESPTQIARRVLTQSPSKTLEQIRTATAPTHVLYDSVIDGRTTDGCRKLNGKTWPIGDPGIVWTPRHFNCRAQNRFVRL